MLVSFPCGFCVRLERYDIRRQYHSSKCERVEENGVGAGLPDKWLQQQPLEWRHWQVKRLVRQVSKHWQGTLHNRMASENMQHRASVVLHGTSRPSSNTSKSLPRVVTSLKLTMFMHSDQICFAHYIRDKRFYQGPPHAPKHHVGTLRFIPALRAPGPTGYRIHSGP